MSQKTPDKKTDSQRGGLLVGAIFLLSALTCSRILGEGPRWNSVLQLVAAFALLLLWIWGSIRWRRKAPFEWLMWTGVLLGSLSDAFGFKAGVLIFMAMFTVGFVGWLRQRLTRQGPNDPLPKHDAEQIAPGNSRPP